MELLGVFFMVFFLQLNCCPATCSVSEARKDVLFRVTRQPFKTDRSKFYPNGAGEHASLESRRTRRFKRKSEDGPPKNFKQANISTVAKRRKKFRPLVRQNVGTDEEKLYRRVVYNEQLTRPDLTNVPIRVTVRIMLIKIQDLVEQSETMETTSRIQIGWYDKRLRWNKDRFSGIREILLPSSSVWLPDLAIINSVDDVYSVVRDTRFEIKVLHTGQVWWHPTGVLRTFCNLHLSYFPFDRQMCPIIIESPTFDSRFLNLRLRSERNPVDLRMYVMSETWHLERAFATSQNVKVGVNTYFSRLEFWLVLERARLYHSINFILPSFILSAIQTIFFFLPVTHPQRVGSTTVTMLSVMVFQSMIVAQLPKTSESVPLLSVYIDIVILVSATSVCASVFTAMCQFNSDQVVPVPKWLISCCSKCNKVKGGNREAKYPITGPALETSSGQQKQVRQNASRRGRITSQKSDQPNKQSTRKRKIVKAKKTNKNSPTVDEFSTLQLLRDPALSVLSNVHSAVEKDDTNKTVMKMSYAMDRRQRIFGRRPAYAMGCESMALFRDNTGPMTDQSRTWLDILKCVDQSLNYVCALATSVGPIVIFGVIPNIVDYEDFPEPMGDNFTLMENQRI